MNIAIPELSLVVLVGASGSGKSTFARRYFKPTEVLSSDVCRGLVSDDENDQAATNDAFDVLHYIASKRLAAAKLVVVDATNVQAEARKPLVALAREYHCLPVAIVLNMPERVCLDRNQSRADRDFGPHVVRNHVRNLRQSLRTLEREGFRHVFVLDSPEQADQARLTREKLYNNKRDEAGPFDIVGDIHGCFDELAALLTKLGYAINGHTATPPAGRKAIFLGDLVDRGPKTPDVLRLVMKMVADGTALCVPGNHDVKLLKKLRGRDVHISYGLAETLEQLEPEPPEFITQVKHFLDGLISHYVLDGGKLVVAHAGMKAEMQGRGSGKVRDFALYGETTGEIDEFGLPIRYPWAEQYRGSATVVYGHTPIPSPEWLNHTINIDTGCVFGGKLTALRWPEREIVSVDSLRTYSEPARPFLLDKTAYDGPAMSAQQQMDDVLDIEDVLGKRLITTRLHGNITIREENAIAALEVMSRFAANPKWLIYLPPTMSPTETTEVAGLLEHPAEAFTYYRNQGVETVVCEEKHMGSRAVIIVCRDEEVVRRRFGIVDEGIGICVSRTGRRFFPEQPTEISIEQELLYLIRDAMTNSNLWSELDTDWICLDCELMPWSVKAQELIRQQYAAVGAAANAALPASVALLELAAQRQPEIAPILAGFREHQKNASLFVDAYRRYCWPVETLADIKLAPFHILATEGAVHSDKDHRWHMQTLTRLCVAAGLGAEGAVSGSGVLQATSHKFINVTDDAAVSEGIAWWEELTGRGGEGMVVKPLDFVATGKRGLIQPAVKCRGREYLRIIYGPDYTADANLSRLRSRGLSAKRSLALREFALGLEGLERFVRHDPLRRVHECVFGVLALESEPVDPRL